MKTQPVTKKFSIEFRIPGIQGKQRVQQVAASAADAKKIITLGYGCDILIDNITELT